MTELLVESDVVIVVMLSPSAIADEKDELMLEPVTVFRDRVVSQDHMVRLGPSAKYSNS